MAEEIPVEIPTPDGRLAGMLHLPRVRRGGSVLMPPAGMRDRSGPARLYVRLARALADDGHAVLRYDGAGLGESEGELPSPERYRAYEAVQEGALAGEILAASGFLRARTGGPLVLFGLCGGALHAAHLARLEPGSVSGVFGLGAPVLRVVTEAGPTAARRRLDSSPEESPSALRRSATRYLRRASDPSAWGRLLRGETDYGALLRALGALAPGRADGLAVAARAKSAVARLSPRGGASRGLDRPRLADVVLDALESVEAPLERRSWETWVRLAGRGVPVALAWGELDGSYCAFEDHVRRAAPELDALLECHAIPEGTHECAGGPAFEQVRELVRAFVARATRLALEAGPVPSGTEN